MSGKGSLCGLPMKYCLVFNNCRKCRFFASLLSFFIYYLNTSGRYTRVCTKKKPMKFIYWHYFPVNQCKRRHSECIVRGQWVHKVKLWKFLSLKIGKFSAKLAKNRIIAAKRYKLEPFKCENHKLQIISLQKSLHSKILGLVFTPK